FPGNWVQRSGISSEARGSRIHRAAQKYDDRSSGIGEPVDSGYFPALRRRLSRSVCHLAERLPAPWPEAACATQQGRIRRRSLRRILCYDRTRLPRAGNRILVLTANTMAPFGRPRLGVVQCYPSCDPQYSLQIETAEPFPGRLLVHSCFLSVARCVL